MGLARALSGAAAQMVAAANAAAAPILAVDAPSGVCATSGAILGSAICAARTVSFVAKKPGLLLAPGAAQVGALIVADILDGVEAARAAATETAVEFTAEGLAARLAKSPLAHKYDHGAALVATGGLGATGAARLAAMAALRVGARLVTLAAPEAAIAECAGRITSLMLRPAEARAAFERLCADRRITSIVLGPGHAAHSGGFERTRGFVDAALAEPGVVVLDADALTAFGEGAGDAPAGLFDLLSRSPATAVLTPHGGEFARLFPDLAGASDKLAAARAAAARSGAVVLFKGPDTVVAAPDGRAGVASAFGACAAPWLATAGAGDVLAGLVAGLAARGWPAYEAAATAAVLHQEAGRLAGPGLIAEDLPTWIARCMR